MGRNDKFKAITAFTCWTSSKLPSHNFIRAHPRGLLTNLTFEKLNLETALSDLGLLDSKVIHNSSSIHILPPSKPRAVFPQYPFSGPNPKQTRVSQANFGPSRSCLFGELFGKNGAVGRTQTPGGRGGRSGTNINLYPLNPRPCPIIIFWLICPKGSFIFVCIP